MRSACLSLAESLGRCASASAVAIDAGMQLASCAIALAICASCHTKPSELRRAVDDTVLQAGATGRSARSAVNSLKRSFTTAPVFREFAARHADASGTVSRGGGHGLGALACVAHHGLFAGALVTRSEGSGPEGLTSEGVDGHSHPAGAAASSQPPLEMDDGDVDGDGGGESDGSPEEEALAALARTLLLLLREGGLFLAVATAGAASAMLRGALRGEGLSAQSRAAGRLASALVPGLQGPVFQLAMLCGQLDALVTHVSDWEQGVQAGALAGLADASHGGAAASSSRSQAGRRARRRSVDGRDASASGGLQSSSGSQAAGATAGTK